MYHAAAFLSGAWLQNKCSSCQQHGHMGWCSLGDFDLVTISDHVEEKDWLIYGSERSLYPKIGPWHLQRIRLNSRTGHRGTVFRLLFQFWIAQVAFPAAGTRPALPRTRVGAVAWCSHTTTGVRHREGGLCPSDLNLQGNLFCLAPLSLARSPFSDSGC